MFPLLRLRHVSIATTRYFIGTLIHHCSKYLRVCPWPTAVVDNWVALTLHLFPGSSRESTSNPCTAISTKASTWEACASGPGAWKWCSCIAVLPVYKTLRACFWVGDRISAVRCVCDASWRALRPVWIPSETLVRPLAASRAETGATWTLYNLSCVFLPFPFARDISVPVSGAAVSGLVQQCLAGGMGFRSSKTCHFLTTELYSQNFTFRLNFPVTAQYLLSSDWLPRILES